MSKTSNGSAVPRHFVFILTDGAFVVQLDENRVQDLLTGQFRELTDNVFGHAITDYELNQLKAAGRVEHYNRNTVWVYSLPEPHQYDPRRKTQERIRNRVRMYYLNTTLPKAQLENVRMLLHSLGLDGELSADNRDGVVAVEAKDGALFMQFRDAENVLRHLTAHAPDLFGGAAVAFTEVSLRDAGFNQEIKPPGAQADLKTIIASQTDTTMTAGKRALLLVGDDEERDAIRDLCAEMKLLVAEATTAADALEIMEDEAPDLLVMDLQLPDMHGWEMLGKIKEIDDLADLPIIVIAEHSAPNQQSLALTVAKVDVYLMKPVSRARLRQNIWMAFKGRQVM